MMGLFFVFCEIFLEKSKLIFVEKNKLYLCRFYKNIGLFEQSKKGTIDS